MTVLTQTILSPRLSLVQNSECNNIITSNNNNSAKVGVIISEDESCCGEVLSLICFSPGKSCREAGVRVVVIKFRVEI